MKENMLAISLLVALSLGAAEVEDVIVRQQWPWSTDVKVEYALSGVDGTHPVDIAVRAFNGDEELDAYALSTAITGDRYGITDSVGSFTIDPVKAFGTSRVALGSFRVKLTLSSSAGNLDEVLYKVFDLASAVTPRPCTNITRRDLLNGKYGSVETDYGRIGAGFKTTLADVLIWTAVTNGTEYKTDKLVLRKIPANGATFKVGSPSGEVGTGYSGQGVRETQHDVRLTEDFYIGVFEMTQAQFAKFYTVPSGGFTDQTDSDVRPVVKVTYGSELRGLIDWKAEDGSASRNECINWPTNDYRHCVRYNRALGVMRSRLGVKIDLPTEAQWEFACRAGSTNALYSGKEMTTTASADANVDEIAWTYHSNYSDAPGGTGQTRPVGLKKPNAFGLYDMAGNASEWCLDWYNADISTFYDGIADVAHVDPLVDPVGCATIPTDKSRSVRGGNWSMTQICARSAYRQGAYYSTQLNYVGFRVVCPASADWK